jgi:hypothetical protein
MQFSISPAVTDNGVKDTCRSKLKHARDSVEKTLSHSVVDKATCENDSIKILFHEEARDNHTTDMLIMKAFRVVLRTFKGRQDDRDTGRPQRNRNFSERRRFTSWRRPFTRPRRDYRFSTVDGEDRDFPPPPPPDVKITTTADISEDQ